MAQTGITERSLKRAVKEALAETLQEQRELLHDVFAEVLEDFALAEAIGEGMKSQPVTRAEALRTVTRCPTKDATLLNALFPSRLGGFARNDNQTHSR